MGFDVPGQLHRRPGLGSSQGLSVRSRLLTCGIPADRSHFRPSPPSYRGGHSRVERHRRAPRFDALPPGFSARAGMYASSEAPPVQAHLRSWPLPPCLADRRLDAARARWTELSAETCACPSTPTCRPTLVPRWSPSPTSPSARPSPSTASWPTKNSKAVLTSGEERWSTAAGPNITPGPSTQRWCPSPARREPPNLRWPRPVSRYEYLCWSQGGISRTSQHRSWSSVSPWRRWAVRGRFNSRPVRRRVVGPGSR